VLVLLHNELLARDDTTLTRLRQSAPVPPAASRQERVRHLSQRCMSWYGALHYAAHFGMLVKCFARSQFGRVLDSSSVSAIESHLV
jgi:hypothetical protein